MAANAICFRVVRPSMRACVRKCLTRAFSTDLPSMSDSGVTSHRQARQCRGAQGPKTVKGAQSAPELCIKTVTRMCTGISQNHYPCLLTSPFRTGRYLLFRRWTRTRSERLPGGKNYNYATDVRLSLKTIGSRWLVCSTFCMRFLLVCNSNHSCNARFFS